MRTTMAQRMKGYLRLLRPEQWIKNLFVILPMFFGGELLNVEVWQEVIPVFLSFCMVSGAVYCLNDIKDVEADRLHPRKRKRPVASGEVSKIGASVMMLLLISGAMVLVFAAGGVGVGIIVAGYIVLNVIYSFVLKHIAIVDVFCVSLGFVLRLIAGGIVASIWLSPWIVIMVFLLALLLSFGKRRDDVLILEQGGVKARKCIEGYSLSFLNQVLGMLGGVIIVAYLMYTLSPAVQARLGSEYLYVTSVFVLAGILRYLQMTIVYGQSGSPTEIALHDRFVQISVILWIASFVFLLYL